jgi:predicted ATPase
MALPNGTRLGQYEILSPLGAGGMGEVYRARDDRLGRHVAVKVLPAEFASDHEILYRFEQEARSASALNHPAIVTIYEIGESGPTRYIAMELVEGKTLKELVAPGPLPLRKVLSIASQIAEALAKAHAAGIVHRDLKPENVMISNDGFVKILDFGLALRRPLDAMAENSLTAAPTASNLTAAGTVLGTVGYMSPEQASGRPVDFRSDQFSLAAVIYEMGTGKRAFLKDTPMETLAAILRDDPEPLVAVNARVPAPLGWIVERCLAKDPGERYASTRDLARDLAAVRERLLEAPPETGTARETNLPAQRTRFVGRGSELAAAKDLLLRPEVRLLTLTGPGGIGKTRLALQAAGEVADQFPGGIFYVPLAPIGDPDLVAGTISQTVGAGESGGPPLEALKEYLQSCRAPTLLLLDSFEHLIETAPIVADLVAAGPALKVLVTSRSPLHVYGEHEFPVPPLALPDLRKLPPLDILAGNEAVALFVQRAAAVKPGFAATEENAAAIADICARLDGLPLAIELAAARVKLLSPALMRARLEKRLHLLTGGARDLPERQQTLRGAIDWSHDLLNDPEQKLFRRLSVFVGGCTLEAAEAVCNAKGDPGLDVLEGMASMMDKSLVQQPEPEAGEPRFVMLETIREYALERLAVSGDEPVTRRAHAAYCLVLAEEGASEPGLERTGALHRFDAEHGDFRAALDHLTQSGDAEWGLRLATALFGFWETREYLAEGRDRLDTLLKLPGATARTRARALFAAGVLAGEQGDYAAAQKLVGESLEINRELDDTQGIAVALNAMAVNALEGGDPEAARPLFEEALALWRRFGDRVAVARSLSNLANVMKVQRDYATARSLHEETLSIFRDLGDRTGVAWALNHQADAAREQGDVEAARALYAESLEAFRELGDRWGIAATLGDLGNLTRDQADYPGARAFYEESLGIFQDLEHRRGIARLLECFAGCAAAERQPERALLLAGAAAALREKLGAPPPRAEQARLEKSIEPAREALPDRDGATAWMEGWAMPLEKAIETALASGSA